MRKMTGTELALLSGMLMIGHAHGQQLGEVVVTAASVSIPPPPGVWVTAGGPTVTVGGTIYNPVPPPATQTAVQNCAKQVAQALGIQGMGGDPFMQAPGFTTNFVGDYLYHSTTYPLAYYVLPSGSVPPAYLKGNDGVSRLANWEVEDGLTNYGYNNSWLVPSLTTNIYMSAYSSVSYMVGVVVHEWTHQNLDVPGESATAVQQNEQTARNNQDAATQKALQTPGRH